MPLVVSPLHRVEVSIDAPKWPKNWTDFHFLFTLFLDGDQFLNQLILCWLRFCLNTNICVGIGYSVEVIIRQRWNLIIPGTVTIYQAFYIPFYWLQNFNNNYILFSPQKNFSRHTECRFIKCNMITQYCNRTRLEWYKNIHFVVINIFSYLILYLLFS